MPIRRHLADTSTFEPEAITAMSRAFEDACAALHVFAADTQGREIVAARIVDLARTGVTDTQALSARVVRDARTIV